MTVETLIAVLVTGLCSYRLTRFFLFDLVLDVPRHRLHNWLMSKEKKLAYLAMDLTSCSFCLGTWVSLALWAGFLGRLPWDMTFQNWVGMGAVAAVQGLLHTWEPE